MTQSSCHATDLRARSSRRSVQNQHAKIGAKGFLDPSNSKVLGYTIEWGPQRASIPKSFHPDYPDMMPIIEEITAALLAFCSAVAIRVT